MNKIFFCILIATCFHLNSAYSQRPRYTRSEVNKIMSLTSKERLEQAKLINIKNSQDFAKLTILLYDQPKELLLICKEVSQKNPALIKDCLFTMSAILDINKNDKNLKKIFQSVLENAFNSKDSKVIESVARITIEHEYEPLYSSIVNVCNNQKLPFELRIKCLSYIKEFDNKKYEDIYRKLEKEAESLGKIEQMQLSKINELTSSDIGYLITLLKSEDPEKRLNTIIKLRKLTLQNFGFDPIGTPESRRKKIQQWIDWYKRNTSNRLDNK